MNVRTITVFADPGWPLQETVLAEAGLEAQSLRLATPPFPQVLGADNAARAVQLAQELEAAAFVHGLEYVSLGPVGPDDAAAYVEVIPDVIQATDNVFTAMQVAGEDCRLSLLAVRQAAQAVLRLSRLDGDGLAALRFAALARVPAGVPFFPAAYASRGQTSFAIGTEAADLILDAVEQARTLAEARANIVGRVETAGSLLAGIAQKASQGTAFQFAGIDFSPAPFPDEARSLGRALERLGAPRAGQHGTLAAAAFVADALDRAVFPRAGFCGLFLPVVEDVVLAARAAEGTLTVSDLLVYSAVCGAGLDTVPLPGDIAADDLAAIILDVAALALRLNKPLTARLMPAPGKHAGDEVAWDSPYLTPSRVLAPRSGGLHGPLGGVERFELAEKRAH